jgi:hypothetical protein
VIVKVIVENAVSVEEMRSVDIMSMLLDVARMITRMNDLLAYRLRLKFCALCDSYFDHSESLSVRKDGALRAGIADFVIEWAQDPSSVCGSLESYSRTPLIFPLASRPGNDTAASRNQPGHSTNSGQVVR